MSDYDDGFDYGYKHPSKISGWTKSVDWNKGFQAGKAKYFEEYRERKAKREAWDRTLDIYRKNKGETHKSHSGGIFEK